jgi:UDP-N-acetylglucosamine kinase
VNPAAASVSLEQTLEGSILPTFFPDAEPEAQPTLVLLTGQAGAGASRATGRVLAEYGGGMAALTAADLEAFHSDFRSKTDGVAADRARLTADWLRQCLVHARQTHRSLLLDGSFTPTAALATADRFAAEGFRTRIAVVAARRAESLLASLSTHLSATLAGRRSPLVSREVHDQGFERTRALVAQGEDAASVDRLTIFGRDGSFAFDGERDGSDRLHGAADALAAAQAKPLTVTQAIAWFGELRRVTEYVRSTRNPRDDVMAQLVELHELALQEMVPQLPLPRASLARDRQEMRLAQELLTLRRMLMPADASAPSVSVRGPEQGGPSL